MTRFRKSSASLPPPTELAADQRVSKHRRIYDHLLAAIQSGQLKPGDRLPSEAELGELFSASRITVAKAVLDLQRLGYVTRRPGAGTHVQGPAPIPGRTFGLLIPELGLTEIFEPICRGMMRTPFARPDTLLWGNTASTIREAARDAEQLVDSFLAQKVSGIFFAPLELVPEKDQVNRRIARTFERAQIPLVLLDRDFLPYPERSPHDLVGIDNRRAGFLATAHLLSLGVRNLGFLSADFSANTVDARITGFYEALRSHGVAPTHDPVWHGSPDDESLVRCILERHRSGGIVCANDVTAAHLMRTMLALGVRLPEEVRVVGIDDLRWASLLPVPLTTVHQDCAAIGMAAMATMLSRLDHPELPPRDVLIPTRLVVRQSCGTHLASPAASRSLIPDH